MTALEKSYFVLNNHIIRQDGEDLSSVGLVVLQKDIAQTFTMKKDEDEMYFGLQVPNNYKQFSIEVHTITGKVEYEVASSISGKTLW